MTAHPERNQDIASIAARLLPGEAVTMAELRLSIRDTIARGISLVLDRERLLRRISEVIADGTGFPGVAIYVRDGDALQSFELGSRTSAVTQQLPQRLPRTTLEALLDDSSAISFESFPGLEDEQTLSLGLFDSGSLIGAVVILDARPEAFDDEDLSAISVVGEEIGGAVAVAAKHHQIEQFSVIDVETGAHTASFFERRLHEEISRGQRSGIAHAIVLVQIVGFEEFETASGYEHGDALLRRVAETLAALTRTSDLVARYRRTGFSLLLPESDQSGVEVTLERIKRRVEKTFADSVGNVALGPMQLAAGWAIFPTDGVDASSLILAAEQRLLASETELRGRQSA